MQWNRTTWTNLFTHCYTFLPFFGIIFDTHTHLYAWAVCEWLAEFYLVECGTNCNPSFFSVPNRRLKTVIVSTFVFSFRILCTKYNMYNCMYMCYNATCHFVYANKFSNVLKHRSASAIVVYTHTHTRQYMYFAGICFSYGSFH